MLDKITLWNHLGLGISKFNFFHGFKTSEVKKVIFLILAEFWYLVDLITPLWSENKFCMISVLKNLLTFQFLFCFFCFSFLYFSFLDFLSIISAYFKIPFLFIYNIFDHIILCSFLSGCSRYYVIFKLLSVASSTS